jgi:hypothetical protein
MPVRDSDDLGGLQGLNSPSDHHGQFAPAVIRMWTAAFQSRALLARTSTRMRPAGVKVGIFIISIR